jgi:hypothetical protein
VRRSEVLRREHRREHGHERHAAADAEQAGEKAHDCAGREVGKQPEGNHRASMASRLPTAASFERVLLVVGSVARRVAQRMRTRKCAREQLTARNRLRKDQRTTRIAPQSPFNRTHST